MASTTKPAMPGRNFQEYFTLIAPNYLHWTGRSTERLFEACLATSPFPIVDPSSVIHDNASGPCTATTAIISHLGGQEPTRIYATDFNPAMVEAADRQIEQHGWQNVSVALMDSHKLRYASGSFTVVVSNMNISLHDDPSQCLAEMYRTLKPGGVLIITIWKRFGVQHIIEAARSSVRPDCAPMQVSKFEFYQDGYLRDMVVQARFHEVEQRTSSVTSTGEDLKGLRDFILSDFTLGARRDWSEAENRQWPGAVEDAMKQEVSRFGGIIFECWVVTGRR